MSVELINKDSIIVKHKCVVIGYKEEGRYCWNKTVINNLTNSTKHIEENGNIKDCVNFDTIVLDLYMEVDLTEYGKTQLFEKGQIILDEFLINNYKLTNLYLRYRINDKLILEPKHMDILWE